MRDWSPRFAFAALFALAGCTAADAPASNAVATDPAGWRLATGKPPTTAEFAALAATCEDNPKSGSFDACMVDLGLKRAP